MFATNFIFEMTHRALHSASNGVFVCKSGSSHYENPMVRLRKKANWEVSLAIENHVNRAIKVQTVFPVRKWVVPTSATLFERTMAGYEKG